MAQLKLVLFLLLTSLMLKSEGTWAKDTQVHFRVGYLAGKFGGLFTGEFQIDAAMDIDFENFLNHNTSYHFRFIQGLDSQSSRPFYTYAGLGLRRYVLGRGRALEQATDYVALSVQPTLRAYVSADMGVSQVLVKSFGPTVQAVANMLDLSASVGAVYQLTRHFGVEAQAGMSYGYGISSINASGQTQRLLIGLTYFF